MKTYTIKTNREYPIKRKVYNPKTNKLDTICIVQMTEVYVSVLYPKEEYYSVFYNNKRNDCIFHTEDEIPYIKRVLDKLDITHKIEEVS